MTLDVLYANSTNANPRVLPYNSECYIVSGDVDGWMFSNTGIQLCETTCNQLETDPSSQLFFRACQYPMLPL
jgi:hypothetical protein